LRLLITGHHELLKKRNIRALKPRGEGADSCSCRTKAMNVVPEVHSLRSAASQKGASSNGPLPTPTVNVIEIPRVSPEDEERALPNITDDHLEAPPASHNGSLTPSGPPESHRAFSLQDFKRSFYNHYLKDKAIEKSDPYGFTSANASRDPSRSQSPSPCTYAEALRRRGSLGGGTHSHKRT
jgi:hypothetical protein